MMFSFRRLPVLFSIAILPVITVVHAEVYRVPDDFPAIQPAIDAAGDGDTIVVGNGIYTGVGNTDIVFYGKRITLRSEFGPEFCIIDCGGNSRGFNFHNLENEDTVLDGFTIRNGQTEFWGGGIRCENASPAIRNCVITACTTESNGSGIGFINSDAKVFDCRLKLNYTNSNGGGVYCKESRILLENCIIEQNVAQSGGGVFGEQNSSVTIRNSTIWDNLASEYGGGIFIKQSHVAMERCFIWNNAANDAGGARFSTAAPTVSDCVFHGNLAAENGGGIFWDNRTEGTIANCLFTNNAAKTGAGLFVIIESTLEIGNCTLADNTAENLAGSIYNGFSIVRFTNGISWNNLPGEFASSASSQTSIRYSDIKGSYAGEGNIAVNPLFVTGASGGFYLSQAGAGQSATSPCVNAGESTADETRFALEGGWKRMSELTTRTDAETDTGKVDMGYHYTPEMNRYLASLSMPGEFFSPGDICWLDLDISNTIKPWYHVALVVALEVGGQFWFYDGWTPDFDYCAINIPVGHLHKTIIPAFTWPDTGGSSLSGIHFWGAVFTGDFNAIIGGSDGIACWTFGFGP